MFFYLKIVHSTVNPIKMNSYMSAEKNAFEVYEFLEIQY